MFFLSILQHPNDPEIEKENGKLKKENGKLKIENQICVPYIL
jgi:hypothetical protein